jgi:hypothetical protein
MKLLAEFCIEPVVYTISSEDWTGYNDQARGPIDYGGFTRFGHDRFEPWNGG